MVKRKTLRECLSNLDVDDSDFTFCESLEEEFKVIKKAYFKQALKHHPDKGGDPEEFRQRQASFDILRELYQESRVPGHTFQGHADGMTSDTESYESNFDFSNMPTPSWEFY